MSGAIHQDEELVKVNTGDVAVKNFKSYFYQTTAKPDSMTRVFPKDSTIELNDIFSLNERICEKLQSHYNDAGFLISVNVKFSNGKTKTFSSWRAFEEHKWYESEYISRVVICWEFNAVLPQYDVPQRHTLTVKMSNSMRPEEMLNIIFTGNFEDIEELDKNFFPVVARVDFIDRVLGDELLNLVSDWIKGLKDSVVPKSKLMIYLKRHKGKISSLLNLITYIIVTISSVILLNNYIRSLGIVTIGELSSDDFLSVLNGVFVCSGVWVLSKRFINVVTDRIYELLRSYGDNFLFNITNGDRNRQIKLQKREKSNRISIVINLIGTIILNIMCSVIANNLF